MDRLKMHTPNKADENFKKLAALFPNAVTETVDENGAVVRAIDKDVLMQEINTTVVEGKDERYQFTWPDKKKSVLLANAPIAKTLRPCPAESVGKDGTPGGFDSENLYIEGDNLEVLKLLQETYLGKVKMIYIDPPYNTGNDFVYEDDFAQSTEEYLANSGQFDDEGNRLVTNTESNGRFHTDWLNMIYPRLKLAKDLLREDGVIFISIDDNEVCQLRKVCDEIFGESNFAGQFPWRKRTAKSDVPFGVSQDYEWILCYARSNKFVACVEGGTRKYYETDDFPGRPWRIHDLTKQTSASERPNSYFTIINPKTGKEYPANPNRTWAITKDTIETYFAQNRIVFPGDYEFLNISKPALRYFKEDDMAKAGDKFGFIPASTNLPDIVGMTQDGTKEIVSLFNGKIFGFPKPVELIKHFLKISTTASTDKEDIILDFFSGSATTAHAIIAQNFQDVYDGKLKKRKFIMIQLPELCDEKSEAYKAGYKNICEIGKERIRRAGKHEYLDICATAGSSFRWDMEKRQTDKNYPCPENVDIGFRVLKCDSTNMENVYYNPDEYRPDMFEMLADNIKADRTPEDLLFQVMLDLGVLLSSKIDETELGGKRVFNVADNFLIACFDTDVTEETITAIAKQKPYYFVMRDSSLANDSVAINFDQIFATYSPDTVRKVL